MKDVQKFETLNMHKIFVFNYKANTSTYLCKISQVYKTLECFLLITLYSRKLSLSFNKIMILKPITHKKFVNSCVYCYNHPDINPIDTYENIKKL